MNETAISTSAVEQIDNEVTENLNNYLKDKNIPVKLLSLTVGKANPPDSILTQRVKTASEQQRIQTELQSKLAEDNRKEAETSRAQADNAYRQAMNLSPEQFVKNISQCLMKKTMNTGLGSIQILKQVFLLLQKEEQ